MHLSWSQSRTFILCYFPLCILCHSAVLQFYVFIILCSFKYFSVLTLWEQINTGISCLPSSDFSSKYLMLNGLPVLQPHVFDPTNLLFGTPELFHYHCSSHACWDILGTDGQTSYLIPKFNHSKFSLSYQTLGKTQFSLYQCKARFCQLFSGTCFNEASLSLG